MFRLSFALVAFLLLASACQKPIFDRDDDQDPGNTNAKWDMITYESERIFLNMHATPFQLFAISDNEFARFGFENELLEKRPLSVSNGVKGIPALSDNIFMRLTTTAQAHQTIEFHLSRNPTQIFKILADSLKDTTDNHLEIDFLGRRLGAFKDDGTQFLLPAQVFSDEGNFYVFFLFGFQLNPAHDEFVSVGVEHRVEVPELSADFANIASVRFIEGNYYVTSKEGAFRISPDGEYARIFPQWMLDFFPWDGKIYVTGINTFDLHESGDSGLTWTRLNQNSPLKMVEVKGDKLFTHEVEGHVFLLAEDVLTILEIEYDPAIETGNLSNFYAVEFFNGKYYFNVGREIYFTDEIVTK